MSRDHAVWNKTARVRLLELLQDLGWHDYYELAKVAGVRYSARLLELKRLGYEIEDEESSSSRGKRYRLLSLEPGECKGKTVKVYLTEDEAAALVGRVFCDSAVEKIRDALGSFRFNRDKL